MLLERPSPRNFDAKILSHTTRKYSEEYGVPILEITSKCDEQESVKNSYNLHVNIFKSDVKITDEKISIYLFTGGLLPCIAALAFCNLENGKKLIGCAHIYPQDVSKHSYQAKKVLKKFLKKIKNEPSYKDEKVHIYFAGGRCDDGQSELSKNYDSFCQAIINKEYGNTELSGLLIDPYHLTSNIAERNNKMEELKLNVYKSKSRVDDICFCRAGITSEGKIIVRKPVDVSFDYDENKFPTFQDLNEHCKTHLNIDLTETNEYEFGDEIAIYPRNQFDEIYKG